MRRLSLTLLLASLAALAPPAASAVAQVAHFPPTDDLELVLRYIVEDGETEAIALGVVDPDGATRVVTWSTAGPDAGSVGPGSVFALGELTMPFTATLLATMVARGEVAPDDPVAKYLPEGVTVPALGGQEITLEHLAMHRSGLPAEPPGAYDDFTVDDLYAFLDRYELDWVPGRRAEFSTLGYGLLGHALARAAGMPFPALLRERILDPLGMARTGYGADPELAAWMVRGHEGGDVVAPTSVTDALQGGSGLWSSAADMVAFVAANAQLPDTELGRAMKRAQEVRTPYDPQGEGWGWSWRTYTTARQQLLVSHGGRAAGFTALVSFDPAEGIGTVVLAGSGDFNDWAARDLLYFATTANERARVAPEVLQQYVGAYGGPGDRYRATRNRGSVFIRLEEAGHLTYQPAGRIRTPLFPTSDSTFYMVRAPLTVSFSRVDDAMRMRVVTDAREPAAGGEAGSESGTRPGASGRTWTSWRVAEDTPPPTVVAGNEAPWSAWRIGTWILIGLVGAIALILVLRPAWPRRVRRRV